MPDNGNNRVLVFEPPFAIGQAASLVLGQQTFDANAGGVTASSMRFPAAVARDAAGNLYVSERPDDGATCRILQFQPPFSTGMSASLAIGQPDMITSSCPSSGSNSGTSANLAPAGLTFDSAGNLWVADAEQNRILQFVPPFSSGMTASMVLGQADFVMNGPNRGGASVSAGGLSKPLGVALDGDGNLWVADAGNNRVLRYAAPVASSMDATLVLGQPDFVSAVANNGGLSASSLQSPSAIAFDDAGNLWVSEESNNRVLRFTPPFATGMSADIVLGQADFAGNSPNRGGAPSAATLNSPKGLYFDHSGALFIGDTLNNRTLMFIPPFSSGMDASVVLGQPDFVTATTAAPSATSQNMPFDAGVSWIALFVLGGLILLWFAVRAHRIRNAQPAKG